MRIFLHVTAIVLTLNVLAACGVKGDPVPYVETEKQAAQNPAKPQEGQK